MRKLHCQNCGMPKSMDRLSEYYCSGCDTASKEAAEHATREGLDVASARSSALQSRQPHPMMNRPFPGTAFDRVNTSEMERRDAIEPGSLNDPRRGTGRGL